MAADLAGAGSAGVDSAEAADSAVSGADSPAAAALQGAFNGGIMEKRNEHMKKVADEFLQNVKSCFGENLQSVILYGPAARDENAPGRFSIHFLVVVRDNTPSALAPCSVFVKKWAKKGIAVPLFLTQEYIRDSLDTFPLEFMEMKSSYQMIFGEDVLGTITFQGCDVRSECEREIKGKLLHLRAEYLLHRGNRKGLIDLIHRSLNTFRLVFAGALFLKKSAIPEKTAELLKAMSSEYGLNEELLDTLHGIAHGGKKPDKDTDRLFDLYVEELDKLSKALDVFCPTEE
ncbi:MAG: hypothetical protein Q8O92_09490 [Candidatus Latescibacter sp.]|nr:hypothetical protein [Candidatus Latescibacter sp.]